MISVQVLRIPGHLQVINVEISRSHNCHYTIIGGEIDIGIMGMDLGKLGLQRRDPSLPAIDYDTSLKIDYGN